MANFETKSIKDLADGMIAKYTAMRQKYGDTTPLLEKAAVKSLIWAYAGTVGCVWQSIVWIYRQCFPQTCCLAILKLWGGLVGVVFRDGQSTNIELTIENATATHLTTGTIYKDLASGLIYKTVAQANNEDGVIKAKAQCSASGTVGNLPIGTELVIANPLDGIPSKATISSILTQGSEDEDVETYRGRVLHKYQNKSQGGSALDYYNWAIEVAGIVDVFPYTLREGEVTLFCVAEGSGNQRSPSGSLNPNPFPIWSNGVFQDFTGSGQFLQIAKAVEGSSEGVHDRRPMGAAVFIKSPNYTGYSVEILGLTDVSYNDAIKNILIAALDKKRPHIKVLNYKAADAKVNKLDLSAEVSNIIGDARITSFTLKNESGTPIDEETLGIGCLAYLSGLSINGTKITI